MQPRKRASTCVYVFAQVNVKPWPSSATWTHLHLIYILNLQPLGLDKAEQVVPLRLLYAPKLILLQQLTGQSAMPSSNNYNLRPCRCQFLLWSQTCLSEHGLFMSGRYCLGGIACSGFTTACRGAACMHRAPPLLPHWALYPDAKALPSTAAARRPSKHKWSELT